MILDSGTMLLCRQSNTAENGFMPTPKLTPYNKHWYQERTVGMHREYLARGVNERIDLYAYIHEDRKVRIGDYVVLGNGEQFYIDIINHVIEENTNLRYTTLTCHRLDKNYDLATN